MVQFILGLIIGANLGLFFYASLVLAKDADKDIEEERREL